MANRLFLRQKLFSFVSFTNAPKVINCYTELTGVEVFKRGLYSKASLGLDGFIKQRETTSQQMESISEKFKEKMKDYCQNLNNNMIFSEDLKNMIYLATTKEDIDVIKQMIKKYNKQNKQMRFGNFIFGPVIMRLFHHQNLPDVALECFKDPEYEGVFDQLITYQILLDLLYENGQYKEILDVIKMIKDRQVEGIRYPKNAIVLAMAACYKMNSKESLETALNLWKDLMHLGHNPMRRAATFCAKLALNQGDPSSALEIISYCKNQNYTTVRSLKILALTELGRIEQTLPVLKSILAHDTPSDLKQTLHKDVIENLQASLAKSDNVEIVSEINKTIEMLQKQGNINEVPLDDHLCQEIQRPPIMNNRQLQQRNNLVERRPPYTGPRNSQGFQRGRPGLHELV